MLIAAVYRRVSIQNVNVSKFERVSIKCKLDSNTFTDTPKFPVSILKVTNQ